MRFPLCLLAAAAVAAPAGADVARKPNVLFLIADDLRPELGCYGSPARTPHLDALARRGLRFERAYCQQALCNPSRSSFLTGLRPDTLRLWSNGTHFRENNPGVVTLPGWFKKNGYETRCVGKIFHNWHTKTKGDRPSWSADEFLHYATHGDDVPQVKGKLPPNLALPIGRDYGKVPLCERRDVPDEAYYDGRVAAEAVKVLGQVKDRPFFLAVGLWKPHAPFNAPKRYWELYDAKKLPKLDPSRPRGAPELAFHESTEVLGQGRDRITPTAAQVAEMRHGYFANVSFMDAQIGKVLQALDDHKLADRTVVVFVSDHGYHVGEHTLWAKTSCFEFDARVPLIVAAPGMKSAGKKTESLAELIDLFPTLTELCGLKAPAGLEGTSLAPVLADPAKAVKAAAFTQHPRPAYFDRTKAGVPEAMGYSARTAAGRYTEWRAWESGKLLAAEYYDHARDPNELTNRFEAAKDTEALKAARKALHARFPPDRKGASTTAQRPNVLFISVDDLKPALACAGDPHAKTPNIDRLAARGTVFTRAYCQQAVCSPSRSSLLTGRRPDTTKVYDLVTHFRKALPGVVTLPQYFKKNGYYAHGIGKIYHGGYNDEPSWSVPWERTQGRNFSPEGQKLLGKLKAKAKQDDKDVSRVRGLPFEAPDVADDYLNDGWTARRAVEVLKDRKGKKEPFFLAVGFLKPHLPFVAPKKYWELYDAKKLPISESSDPPRGAPRFAPQFGGELRAYHDIPKTGPIPKETARKLVHGYYAAVSYMDAQVGLLLDALKEHGLADNTVVILWGDHGWHLGEHGMWCKHTNYELATRSALLMSVPGQKAAGKKTDALVEFVDIYPTLAEVCKLPRPEGVEGHSFAPLLDDAKRKWKTAAFSQYPRGGGKGVGPLMGYAIRTDRYRYVEWRKRGGTEVVARELYDHRSDPAEGTNVAGVAANKDVLAKLAKQLAAGWKANAPPK